MSFWGYPRPDGSVGTRNYVAVIPTVVCATATARQVSDNVKGSVPFLHHQGCALTPDDLAMANRTLTNLGLNPNIAAVVLISLGCDPMDIDGIAEGIARGGKPVEKLVIQHVGGTIATVEKGTRIARQMMSDASRLTREQFDDSKLMFGSECGGSDTTSGLGGNPAIGAAFDILVKKGGRAVFSETTEFIGAEHLLAKRAVTPEVGEQITRIVRRYEERFLERGVDMRGTNPTKGNIEGGLTTIEEKSLGAISKGGSETIQEIYEYGDRPKKGGLSIVDGPGFDAPSLTALAAAGSTVMLFSTGRGTPHVVGSGTVGPDAMLDRSSPMTSERMSVTKSASGAAIRSRPPLTCERCFRTVLISWMVAPPVTSARLAARKSSRQMPSCGNVSREEPPPEITATTRSPLVAVESRARAARAPSTLAWFGFGWSAGKKVTPGTDASDWSR
jgi:altronate dehydratase large subunit